MGKIFSEDFTSRGTVKLTDRLMIQNIDSSVIQYTTVGELLTLYAPLTSPAFSGNVGIGTTTPEDTLHLYKAGADLWLDVDSDIDTAGIAYKKGGTDKWLNFIERTTPVYGAAANDLIWFNNVTDSVNVTFQSATGRVGIGTTTPTSKLQVVGLPVYANNVAAITGGLSVGAFYRTGANPDPVCVVH
jgi:hypothetical protein